MQDAIAKDLMPLDNEEAAELSKADYIAQLRKLRKASCSSIKLLPFLLGSRNFYVNRLLVQVCLACHILPHWFSHQHQDALLMIRESHGASISSVQ